MARTSPYTVWLFVALVVTVLVTLLLVGRLDGWLVGGGLLLLAASFGLVAGVWLAWLVLTLVAAGDLIAALFMWPAWWTALVNAAMLILLLARPTRRHAVRWSPLTRG